MPTTTSTPRSSVAAAEARVPDASDGPGLRHRPVTRFASVMGVAGPSLSWRCAATASDPGSWPAATMFAVRVAAQAKTLRKVPLGLPAWSSTLPLAAAASATMAKARRGVVYDAVHVGSPASASQIVAAAAPVARAVTSHEICVAE